MFVGILGLIVLLSSCTAKDIIEDTSVNEQILEEEVEEKIEVSPDITREDGYNSIEINFIDNVTSNNIDMNLGVYCIYSKTDGEYNLDNAIKTGYIKEYNSYNGRYTFLLKNGYKFNAKFTPKYTDKIIGWGDTKSNFPFEITANTYGNNKLTQFNILLDYRSDIVDTNIEIYSFE